MGTAMPGCTRRAGPSRKGAGLGILFGPRFNHIQDRPDPARFARMNRRNPHHPDARFRPDNSLYLLGVHIKALAFKPSPFGYSDPADPMFYQLQFHQSSPSKRRGADNWPISRISCLKPSNSLLIPASLL